MGKSTEQIMSDINQVAKDMNPSVPAERRKAAAEELIELCREYLGQ